MAPLSARLSDSVAPLVKTISRGAAPASSATRRRASSTAFSASQPKLWLRLAALPNCGPKKGSMASSTRGVHRRGGVMVQVDRLLHGLHPSIRNAIVAAARNSGYWSYRLWPARMPKPSVSPETEVIEREQMVPLYRVVLLDDNDHTYDYVIEMLQRIFVFTLDQAYRHAEEVDRCGRTVLITCELPQAEFARDQIHSYGPDWRLPRSQGVHVGGRRTGAIVAAPPRCYHEQMTLLASSSFFPRRRGCWHRPPRPNPHRTQPTVTMTMENPAPKTMPVVPPDRVVVTVGDLTITAAQFDQIIDALPEQYRSVARGSGRKQFADNIVRIEVLAQEGKRRKLDESSAYRTQSMFEDANILANMTYEEIGKNVKLDEADVRKYYEAHKAEFEQVRARHILIRVQGSPAAVRPGQKDLTEAEALAKAQDLRKRIQAGEDFAQLARQESDDTGSGANGGDLGFFRHGQMVPSFEQAAFALQPGDLSEPVKSPFGYHLIKVEAKESKSFEEVRPELERRMRPEQAQKTLEELQKKTPVVLDPDSSASPRSRGRACPARACRHARRDCRHAQPLLRLVCQPATSGFRAGGIDRASALLDVHDLALRVDHERRPVRKTTVGPELAILRDHLPLGEIAQEREGDL